MVNPIFCMNLDQQESSRLRYTFLGGSNSYHQFQVEIVFFCFKFIKLFTKIALPIIKIDCGKTFRKTCSVVDFLL